MNVRRREISRERRGIDRGQRKTNREEEKNPRKLSLTKSLSISILFCFAGKYLCRRVYSFSLRPSLLASVSFRLCSLSLSPLMFFFLKEEAVVLIFFFLVDFILLTGNYFLILFSDFLTLLIN